MHWRVATALALTVLSLGCQGGPASPSCGECNTQGESGECLCPVADAGVDAGSSPDSGVDAGSTDGADAGGDGGLPDAGTLDAGEPDAGEEADGGLDAGAEDAGLLLPTASADSFSTFVDSPVRVAAPGILGNDLAAPGQALSATLETPPPNGSLTLSPDGAFVYLPNSGYTGADTFSYRAQSSAGMSGPSVVTLTVAAPFNEKTLVILVYHPENTLTLPTVAQMKARLTQVSANYREYSYNAVTLSGVVDPSSGADVVGWYQAPSTNCFDLGNYFTLADADADYTQYSRLVVVLAQRSGCNLSAYGYYGKQSYTTPDGWAYLGFAKLSLPNASVGTLAHELGHTFNNGHGYFLDCGSVSWAASGCASVEYGDPYDFMSLGTGHPSARRKELMGWFNPASNRILEVTASGTYLIEPLETNTGGVKALRLPRGGDYPLYLEYRQRLGTDAAFSSSANVFTGLLVHAGGNLLDMTPPAASYGPGVPTDAQLTPVLPVGASWVDPLTGNTVKALSAGAAGINVEISVISP